MELLTPTNPPKRRTTPLFTKKSILYSSLILIVVLLLSLSIFYRPHHHTVSADRYLVIYEAGSSHTSAFIFTWKEPFADFREYVASKSIEPGLSSFAKNPSEIPHYLQFLLFHFQFYLYLPLSISGNSMILLILQSPKNYLIRYRYF